MYDKNYEVQSVLFSKDVYSVQKAINWILKNNYKIKKLDETEHYLRFRQLSPQTLRRHGYIHFRTIKIGEGIDLLIAYRHLHI